MNRFLVPLALAALVAGCAQPGMFGLQPKQLVVVDSTPGEAAGAPTVIVRDIYHEASVVNQNTVYVEQPAPAETVYVEQEYETYVYVSEPPSPRPRNPRWSPREQEPPAHNQRPRVPFPVRAKPLPPGGHPVPMPPAVIVPQQPSKKTVAPAPNGPQKSPDRPKPPVRQAPAQGGSAPAAPVQPGGPKQVPPPPADKPASPGSGA
ncbi:MAG: hypothetical protein NTX53_01620 [candidate division WOR-3 bacterium]|nr:hypothetical protein [candidate division WOR-3 bacterium]